MVILSNFFNEAQFKYFLDKYKDLNITLFYDVVPNEEQLKLNPRNFLLLHEPNSLFGGSDAIIPIAHKFELIFTYDKRLLKLLPNTIKFHNSTLITVDDPYYDSFEDYEKKFELSYLCGVSNWTEGHKFRQRIFKLKNQIIIPKKWHYVLEDFDISKQVRPGYKLYSKDLTHVPDGEAPEHYGKRFLYTNPMFHLCVENVKQDNWYTEKITQAFATKTLPIYWGCENLNENGYNEQGIIRFKDEEDLINIVNNLTPEDYYKRLPYINYNYKRVKDDTFRKTIDTILNYIK